MDHLGSKCVDGNGHQILLVWSKQDRLGQRHIRYVSLKLYISVSIWARYDTCRLNVKSIGAPKCP